MSTCSFCRRDVTPVACCETMHRHMRNIRQDVKPPNMAPRQIAWPPAKFEQHPTRKYPWLQMHNVGDYFDVPPEFPAQQRGVVQAAHQQAKNNGKHYRVLTLPTKAKRVMLTYIED